MMRRGYRHFILFFVLSLCALTSTAQSDGMFTQYFAIPAHYNPAAPGNDDYLRINGAARLQWVGMEGAPKDFYVGGGLPVVLMEK